MEAREEREKESHECSGHEAEHQKESLRNGHVLTGLSLNGVLDPSPLKVLPE